MYIKARMGQRFVSMLIDGLIVCLLAAVTYASIIIGLGINKVEFENDITPALVEPVLAYVEDTYKVKLDKIDENVYFLIAEGTNEQHFYDFFAQNYPDIDANLYVGFYQDCVYYSDMIIQYTAKTLIAFLGSLLAVFIIYFDILGYLWRRQTIGRWLTGIKVINLDGISPSILRLFLRDVLGFFLFNILNIFFMAPLILNIVLLSSENRMSVGDSLAKVIVVNCDSAGNPIAANDIKYSGNQNDSGDVTNVIIVDKRDSDTHE